MAEAVPRALPCTDQAIVKNQHFNSDILENQEKQSQAFRLGISRVSFMISSLLTMLSANTDKNKTSADILSWLAMTVAIGRSDNFELDCLNMALKC